MRVAFNALFLDPGVSGGTETYLRELVPALAAIGVEPRVLTTRRGAAALRADGWRDVVALPSDEGQRLRRLAGEQLGVPHRARACDVLHSLGNTGPLRPGIPHVLTVHDLQFFTTETMGLSSTVAYRVLTRAAAARADAVITVSEAARAEIRAILGVEATAIPHGAGRQAAAPEDVDRVRARHALDGGPVVLCVAAKRPHKNQELLLRALPDGATLVLAGHPEAYDGRLRELAREEGVADRVRFIDAVPDPELEALWRIAGCAALPTRAEGFGLPVIEALRRGVAVACSDLPVLREVAGDAAHYFDPEDPASARAAIEHALADDGARGPARAARFTWERSARAHLEVYERCMSA
jgi:glycosyltransferase involved in cell wall biosynthesis